MKQTPESLRIEPPVIEFANFPFEESRFIRGNKVWMATTLLQAVHEQELEPFEYPLACYDMSNLNFKVSNMYNFCDQMKRVLAADYDNHPIILDDLGQVADGNHRICRAILDGKNSILAYRLISMPEPDFIENE